MTFEKYIGQCSLKYLSESGIEGAKKLWNAAIENYKAEVKVQIAEITNKEIEEYVDKYIDMGCFRNPEIARPYLLDGFQLGCEYTKKKISNLSASNENEFCTCPEDKVIDFVRYCGNCNKRIKFDED